MEKQIVCKTLREHTKNQKKAFISSEKLSHHRIHLFIFHPPAPHLISAFIVLAQYAADFCFAQSFIPSLPSTA